MHAGTCIQIVGKDTHRTGNNNHIILVQMGVFGEVRKFVFLLLYIFFVSTIYIHHTVLK